MAVSAVTSSCHFSFFLFNFWRFDWVEIATSLEEEGKVRKPNSSVEGSDDQPGVGRGNQQLCREAGLITKRYVSLGEQGRERESKSERERKESWIQEFSPTRAGIACTARQCGSILLSSSPPHQRLKWQGLTLWYIPDMQ
jgi:hypothetical protein